MPTSNVNLKPKKDNVHDIYDDIGYESYDAHHDHDYQCMHREDVELVGNGDDDSDIAYICCFTGYVDCIMFVERLLSLIMYWRYYW